MPVVSRRERVGVEVVDQGKGGHAGCACPVAAGGVLPADHIQGIGDHHAHQGDEKQQAFCHGVGRETVHSHRIADGASTTGQFREQVNEHVSESCATSHGGPAGLGSISESGDQRCQPVAAADAQHTEANQKPEQRHGRDAGSPMPAGCSGDLRATSTAWAQSGTDWSYALRERTFKRVGQGCSSCSVVLTWVQARRQEGSARSRIQRPRDPSCFTISAGADAA